MSPTLPPDPVDPPPASSDPASSDPATSAPAGNPGDAVVTTDAPGADGATGASGGPGSRHRLMSRVLLYLLAAAGVGAVTGLIWWQVVTLPVYRVGADGGASTSERGLTEYIAGDAWFSLIGLLAGVGLGLLAWRQFRRLGWPVVPLVIGATLIAALVCWWVGWQLGPGPFAERLAEAQPGAAVPIELTVRARVALLVWPFGGVLVTLLGSSLGRDDEQPRPLFPGRRHEVETGG